MNVNRALVAALLAVGATLLLLPAPAAADQVINDDLIVDGSICAGLDCVNGESFGFDTLRLKENNLRIRFQDTSSSASFPTFDWMLVANDSSNGGRNRFSIECTEQSRESFTIEGCAPSNSLYVDDGGRVGFGTSTPVVELHVVDGDTPTLRLEQDGSSGFTPQTWDVAGNEANFFVRDVTGGSRLSFKIKPGALTDSLVIAADGDVGFGTQSPGSLAGNNNSASIHVVRSDGDASILVEENSTTATAKDMLELKAASAPVRLRMNRESIAQEWTLSANNVFVINNTDNAGNEFSLNATGTLTIAGSINTTDCSPCVSDYVFEPDYELMPLAELEAFIKTEKHLPNVPSQADVDRAGKLNMTEMQMKLLEKIEELVLYTLEQQRTIDGLTVRNADLTERLARIESALPSVESPQEP